MGPRERKAFLKEVYGPDATGYSIAEQNQRSQAASAARVLATSMRLPQSVIDRAASYAAELHDPIEGVRRAAEMAGITV